MHYCCSKNPYFFLGQGTIGHGMFHASQHLEQLRQYLFLYLIMKNKAYISLINNLFVLANANNDTYL